MGRSTLKNYAIGLATLTLLGCGQNKTAGKTTTIGAVLWQSEGGTTVYNRALELALTEINKAGGVLDGGFAIDIKDSRGEKYTAVLMTRELIKAKVPVVLGDVTSSLFKAVTGETIQAGVVALSGSATNPAITDLHDNDTVFRNAPSDAFQGPALAQLVYDSGYRRIGVFQSDEDYGKGLNTVFTAAFNKLSGASIIGLQIYPDDAALDYTDKVKAMLALSPDAVVFTSHSGSGGKVLQDWAVLRGRVTLPAFVADAFKSSNTKTDVGGAEILKGIYGTAPAPDFTTDHYKTMQKAWIERFAGEDPSTDAFAAHYYDAAFVVALAIEKAGKAEPTAIRDALREVANPPGEVVGPGEFAKAVKLIRDGVKINYEGASGSCDFDVNGDVPAAKIELWKFDDAGDPEHVGYSGAR